jgi:hypothetical protein
MPIARLPRRGPERSDGLLENDFLVDVELRRQPSTG